jgi:hypothetical protein
MNNGKVHEMISEITEFKNASLYWLIAFVGFGLVCFVTIILCILMFIFITSKPQKTQS